MDNLFEKPLLSIKKCKDGVCFQIDGSKNKSYCNTNVDTVIDYLCNNVDFRYESNWNLTLNKSNYLRYITNIEVRSIFEEVVFDNHNLIDNEITFLFLTPISEQGYNFGQYRIASHLVRLGVKHENIIFFPLRIYNGKYNYNDKKLLTVLNQFSPTFVCESVYTGWETGIKKINSFIKQNSDAIILTGGPLTSSNTEYCIKKLNTDIIFLGHGEYQLEFFLKTIKETKSLLPKHNIPGVYYTKDGFRKEVHKVLVNRYMNNLYWDMPLMESFCSFSPVINLFTSEECHGNCIFCYRTSTLKDNKMSKEELINRLKYIVEYDPGKNKNINFIRFFDDDFFAASDRDGDLLDSLYNILYPRYRIFELTFSIRSFNNAVKKNSLSIINKIKRLELKRVTIGVDGFNDNDLKFLKKGYKIKDVFAVADLLSRNKIPILMYAILTTLNTDFLDLFISLHNMLKLTLMGEIYIGPSITPSIYVNNNNIKLYSEFSNEDFAYLVVESLEKTFKEEDNVYKMVMTAKILSRDRLVRRVVSDIGIPTSMESAYIIPILNVYFRCIANEVNFLKRSLTNFHGISSRLIRSKQKHMNNINIANRHKKSMYDEDNSTFIINYINSEKRKLNDICEYLDLISEKKHIESRLNCIKELLEKYTSYFFNEKRYYSQPFGGQLSDNIRRLLAFPILIFKKHLEEQIKEEFPTIIDITFDDLLIYDNEVEIFERLF